MCFIELGGAGIILALLADFMGSLSLSKGGSCLLLLFRMNLGVFFSIFYSFGVFSVGAIGRVFYDLIFLVFILKEGLLVCSWSMKPTVFLLCSSN